MTLTTDGVDMWLAKCPLCKKHPLTVGTKKKLFGLRTVNTVECNGCGTTFTKEGGNYRLDETKDVSNEVWAEYSGKILKEHEWKNIANGGVSDSKQKENDIEEWLGLLKEGNIPLPVSATAIILKRDENAHMSLPNIALFEPRAIRTGTYAGPSFRVAKGLYFKVGGFRSASHEELKQIDFGVLTLTNKRIVFSGVKRSVDIALEKIISMEPYSDAVAIRRKGKQKTEYFSGINQASLKIKIHNREYEETQNGVMLMYIIEGLIKKISQE